MSDARQSSGEPTLHNLNVRLTTHEQVCQERQGTIIQRLVRIEKIIISGVGFLLLTQFDFLKSIVAAFARHP